MACVQLTAGLSPSCAAEKAVGGIDKRVYIGQLDQIDWTTTTFGANNEITAFGLTTNVPAYTLKKFIGKKLKNNTVVDGVVGENTNMFNQSLNLVLYARTAAEKKAVNDLFLAEGLFAIVETNGSALSPAQLEVYGIGNDVGSPDNYGLSGSAYQNNSGTLLNDPNNITVTLSGEHPNDSLVFIPASSLAANLTLLDGMSV